MTGEFTPAARRAILEACLDRCAGCGHTGTLETQHRRARGMGGTSRGDLGEAVNGVALCRRCHAWTEANPAHARALGWRLDRLDNPLEVPWWTTNGWRRWVIVDGTPLVRYKYVAPAATPAASGPVNDALRDLDRVTRITRTV